MVLESLARPQKMRGANGLMENPFVQKEVRGIFTKER
jgi:hypothetical protein